MLDSATGGHWAPSSHDVAISPSPSFGEYELGDDRLCLEQSQPWLERRIGRSWLAEPVVVVIWAAEHAFAPLLTGDGGLDLVFAGYRVVSVLPFLAVWTVLYYAFGRRVLPIMVARWVFNGGSALGRSTWANDDAIRSGWRNHDQVVPYRGTGWAFPALMIARTAGPVGAQDVRRAIHRLWSGERLVCRRVAVPLGEEGSLERRHAHEKPGRHRQHHG
jgi:hypothetical protein